MKAILKINYNGVSKGTELKKVGTYYELCGRSIFHEDVVERENDIFELVKDYKVGDWVTVIHAVHEYAPKGTTTQIVGDAFCQHSLAIKCTVKGYDVGFISSEYLRKATNEEIRKALLEEAKRRYPIGSKFKNAINVNHDDIGESINGIFTVKEYKYIDYYDRLGIHSGNAWLYYGKTNTWAEIVKPILTTIDGVDIYEGMKCYAVLPSMIVIPASTPTGNPELKYFSTFDLANQYVMEHKPKFTTADGVQKYISDEFYFVTRLNTIDTNQVREKTDIQYAQSRCFDKLENAQQYLAEQIAAKRGIKVGSNVFRLSDKKYLGTVNRIYYTSKKDYVEGAWVETDIKSGRGHGSIDNIITLEELAEEEGITIGMSFDNKLMKAWADENSPRLDFTFNNISSVSRFEMSDISYLKDLPCFKYNEATLLITGFKTFKQEWEAEQRKVEFDKKEDEFRLRVRKDSKDVFIKVDTFNCTVEPEHRSSLLAIAKDIVTSKFLWLDDNDEEVNVGDTLYCYCPSTNNTWSFIAKPDSKKSTHTMYFKNVEIRDQIKRMSDIIEKFKSIF